MPAGNDVASRLPASLRTGSAVTVAAVGAVAAVVTIASYLGISPIPSPTPTLPPEGAVTIVGASLETRNGLTEYKLQGTSSGISDPPWRIYVLAEPKDAGGEVWSVSNPVKPDSDGTWDVTLRPEGLLRASSTAVTFRPVLVLSDVAIHGGCPQGACVGNPDDAVDQELRIAGPYASVVSAAYEPFNYVPGS